MSIFSSIPDPFKFKRCRNQHDSERCIGLLGHKGPHWRWNDEEDGERTWSWTAGSDIEIPERHYRVVPRDKARNR